MFYGGAGGAGAGGVCLAYIKGRVHLYAKKRGSAVYWMGTTDYHKLERLHELNAVAARLSREHHPTIEYIDRPQSAMRFYNEFHDNEFIKSLNVFGTPKTLST